MTSGVLTNDDGYENRSISPHISSAVGFAARKAASILGVRANGQPSNRKAICRAVGLEAQNAASISGVWGVSPCALITLLTSSASGLDARNSCSISGVQALAP